MTDKELNNKLSCQIAFSAASAHGCIDFCEVCDVMGADYTSSVITNQQSAANNCTSLLQHISKETTQHTLWIHRDIHVTTASTLLQWWCRQSGLQRCWQRQMPPRPGRLAKHIEKTHNLT